MTVNRMTTGGFKLGTFSTNCSSGMTPTQIPDRWDASWDSNVTLAKMLDEAGIDFMLPIARWIGYGGPTDFHGGVLETMTWAAGLLASTKNLTVFATIHTTANHPIVVAKQIATIDQIGHGRAGLNIVAGWNKPEYDAMGIAFADDHETRYGYAQEWFDLIRKVWKSDDHFDWDGTYFKNIRGQKGRPAPVRGNVPIINAAGSPQGRDFATSNANFLFTPAIDLARTKTEIGELKANAAAKGRDVNVLTFSHIVCRPTEKEARDYVHYVVDENADWEATDNLIRLQFAFALSFPHDLLAQMRFGMALGHGGFPLIGTPDQVAAGLIKLHEAGLAGTTLSFVNYVKEFPYFADEVLPRLAKAGIR